MLHAKACSDWKTCQAVGVQKRNQTDIEMDATHVYCAQYTDGILLVMHFVLVVECFLCKVIFGQTTSGSDSCELPAKRTWNPYGPETADRRPLKEQCGTPKHY